MTISPTVYPETAIVLAAGLGTRMRPLTDKTPKPLLKVCDKTLIDYALDTLAATGVGKTVVNVHYLADQIENHLEDRISPEIIVSDERGELLDSGGGAKKALDWLGPKPFYLLNADSFWVNDQERNLAIMADVWDADKMDILLLVANHDQAVGFDGKGDFFMAPDGRLTRRGKRPSAPYIYAGAGIYSPKIIANGPDGAFSLNLLFDEAIKKGRFYAVPMKGLWLHVGTPAAIAQAEQAIAAGAVL